MASIKEEFNKAVQYIQSGPAIPSITNELKLKFYGLFKQATSGVCTEKAPSRLKPVQRAKWDAWNKLGSMSKTDAMKEYMKALENLVPKWREWNTDGEEKTLKSKL